VKVAVRALEIVQEPNNERENTARSLAEDSAPVGRRRPSKSRDAG
jgi:hypothetical protein